MRISLWKIWNEGLMVGIKGKTLKDRGIIKKYLHQFSSFRKDFAFNKVERITVEDKELNKWNKKYARS